MDNELSIIDLDELTPDELTDDDTGLGLDDGQQWYVWMVTAA